jgi:hypothetical protein
MITCETLFTNTARVWFIIVHLGLATTIVDAKGEICLSHSRLSILGTDISGRVLAEFSSVSFHSIKAMIAVALVACWRPTLSFVLGNTLRSMQTYVVSTWTNLKFVLTLDAEITIGTNTVFKKLRMGQVVVLHFLSQRIQKGVIFLPLATRSSVLTIQRATSIHCIMEFAA